MAIIIQTKKEIRKGVKGYLILRVHALEPNELPEKYLKHYPHLFFAEYPRRLIIKTSPYLSQLITEKSFINAPTFDELLSHVYKAGERLKSINSVIREEMKTWHGECVFKI